MKVKDIKSKVATKVAKGKAKVTEKCRHTRKAAGAAAVTAMLLALIGCATSEPASRLTKGGETRIEIAGSNHKITMTIDSSVASSSDSKGSTETVHANPTNSTSVPISVRYNDALKTATTATASTLSQIGSGLGAVLDMLLNKGTGTVAVTKKDGTSATVKCENGQCEFCPTCVPQQ